MIKAIAIDDEPLALKVLENFCARLPDLDLQAVFLTPSKALDYLQTNTPDLVFVDIRMPGMTGIELATLINKQTLVIFTTAYSEFAVKSYDLQATDYLLKPFTFERFEQAVKRASEQRGQNLTAKEETSADYILIKADYSLQKVFYNDIRYIEGYDDYVKIHIAGGKIITARYTMKTLIQMLPENHFLRIHKSFIVNVSKISKITSRGVHIETQSLPIGKIYAKKVKEAFNQ